MLNRVACRVSIVAVSLAFSSSAFAQPLAATPPIYAPDLVLNLGGQPYPNAATVDSKGRLIIVNPGIHTVEVWSCTAEPCAQVAHYGTGAPTWIYQYEPPSDLSTADYIVPTILDPIGCELSAGDPGERGAQCLAAPQGVAIDAADRIYVTDTGNYRVLVFNSADDVEPDGTLKLAYSFGQFAGTVVDVGPFGFDGEPLRDDNGDVVNVLFVQASEPAVDHFGAPWDIAVYKNTGQVFVLDQTNNRIAGFTPPCDAVSSTFGYPCTAGPSANFKQFVSFGHRGDQASDPAGLVFPTGLGIDQRSGDLGVADSGRHRALVYRYPFTPPATGAAPDPTFNGSISPSAFITKLPDEVTDVFGRTTADGPVYYQQGDVAFDRAHRLFILDSVAGSIHAFAPAAGGTYAFQFTIQKESGVGTSQFAVPQGIDIVQPNDLGNDLSLEDDPLGLMVIADSFAARVQVLRHPTLSAAVSLMSASASLDQPIPATITVTNTGALPLINVVPVLSNYSAVVSSVAVTPAAGVTLAPGEQHIFTASLTPQSTGTLNLKVSATGSTHFDGGLSGIVEEPGVTAPIVSGAPVSIGCGAASALTLQGASLSATATETGGTVVLHVTLSNCAAAPLTALPMVTTPGSFLSMSPATIPLARTLAPAGTAGDSSTWAITYTAGQTGGTASLVVSAQTAAGVPTGSAPITLTLTISTDVTPPTISLTITPNATDVVNRIYHGTVTGLVHATDADSGIAAVRCSYIVASTLGGPRDCSSPVTGHPNAVDAPPFVLPDGQIALTVCAVDAAAPTAHEVCEFRTLVIDNTPPNISWSISSAPNAAGWYNRPVTASFVADDTLSRIASIETSIAPTAGTTFVLNDPDAVFNPLHVVVNDAAGNSVVSDRTFRIDQLKPRLLPIKTPAANADGWNNSLPVVLSWNIFDPVPPTCPRGACQASGLLSVGMVNCPLGGCQPAQVTTGCPGSCTGAPNTVVSTEGMSPAHIVAAACDVAGNCDTADAFVLVKPIRVDVVPPDSYNQFDPATKDNLVFGRDTLSGLATPALAPISPVFTTGQWTHDDDGDDDCDHDGTPAQIRVYTIADTAGNKQILTEKVHASGKEVHVDVLGYVYNTGCPSHCAVQVGTVPSATTKKFEWATNKDGSLKTLNQNMTIGRGKNRVHVKANYDEKKNQTVIQSDAKGPSKVTLTGLVLLRLATRTGGLAVEYTNPTTGAVVLFLP